MRSTEARERRLRPPSKPCISLRQLQTERALGELHHFLWLEPHWNQGLLDHGWNCRDHAWATALLAKAAGHDPYLFHGKASFIAKRRGAMPGLVLEQSPHTWIGIDGVGLIDLSVKTLAAVDGEQFRLPMTHVFANSVRPDGRAGFGLVRDEGSYRRSVEGAQRANKSIAIYMLSRGEALGPELIARCAAWINSPLTDWLRARFSDPSATYCRLVSHMIALLTGEASSLAGLSKQEAWDRVVGDAPMAPTELQSLLALS